MKGITCIDICLELSLHIWTQLDNDLFLEFICRGFVECFMFIREIDLKFSFVVTFLSGFGIRLVAS